MRIIDIQTTGGKKIWNKLVARQTGNADPLQVRRDPITLRVFGKPCSAREAVSIMLEKIRSRGDRALCQYSKLLDHYAATPEQLQVSAAERRLAEKQVPSFLKQALREAAGHILEFHRAQLAKTTPPVKRRGVQVYERRLALQRVGIYVPSGNAPLVSTVLMNALPAQVAGVAEIYMATPPAANGRVEPALLFAAGLAGVKNIYRLGGAAAIAAFAFGTERIPAVEKIVGPANVFGTEAKRQVVGQVGIDSLAGPSEILIVADETARADDLAWDLLAQGEHGSGAVAILLSASLRLLQQVAAGLQVTLRGHPELRLASQAITLFKTRDVSTAVVMANEYAPEHLSLQVRNPRAWLPAIAKAGAIFLGPMTAQAMGDYTAGTNHVLPTHGTAAWASALSVRDFMRHTSVVEYTAAGMQREGKAAMDIAGAEGLRAHRQSIQQRMAATK